MQPPAASPPPPLSRRSVRLPLLLPGVAALVCAVLGGLRRAGLAGMPAPEAAVTWHGPLMVVGFLGTLIGLERAAAAGRLSAHLAPVATGAAALAVLAGASPALLGAAGAASGGILLALLWGASRRVRSEALRVQALGAAAFALGSAGFAATERVAVALPGWLAFFALTIAGERLELARFRVPPARARVALRLVVGLLLVAGVLAPITPVGWRLLGAGFLLLAAWLARHDVASRSLRRPGLTRFMAVALLAGYAWLAVAGALMVVVPRLGAAGPAYDASLHAFALGFVFSMVFAHGPVILPALLGLRCEFRRRFYLHLGLLHVGLVVRLAGDALARADARALGAAMDAAAIALFFLQTVTALRRPRAAGRAAVAASSAG